MMAKHAELLRRLRPLDYLVRELKRDLGYLPDIVVGSPPCQGISTANCKGTGITDDHLFWEWARIVFEVRPLWCAAENSPNARLDGIDRILDALDQAGGTSSSVHRG
jgi:DNA (cytosine-5)-methyltransferase 1